MEAEGLGKSFFKNNLCSKNSDPIYIIFLDKTCIRDMPMHTLSGWTAGWTDIT